MPVVPHVAAPVEVSSSQYVAQSDAVYTKTPVSLSCQCQLQAQSKDRITVSGIQTNNCERTAGSTLPAQSQATIYYQGQVACPTVYGVTSPYSRRETPPPIVQVTNFGTLFSLNLMKVDVLSLSTFRLLILDNILIICFVTSYQ